MGVRWVTLYDVMYHKDSREIVESRDKRKFNILLHKLGLDIYREIEFQEVYVRSVLDPKLIVFGRWIGFERDDEEWLDSPMCSLDHRIDCISLKDFWLAQDLREMSRESNWTGLAMEEEGEQPKSTEVYRNEIVSLLEDSEKVREFLEMKREY